jgi:hypothetical protein
VAPEPLRTASRILDVTDAEVWVMDLSSPGVMLAWCKENS